MTTAIRVWNGMETEVPIEEPLALYAFLKSEEARYYDPYLAYKRGLSRVPLMDGSSRPFKMSEIEKFRERLENERQKDREEAEQDYRKWQKSFMEPTRTKEAVPVESK